MQNRWHGLHGVSWTVSHYKNLLGIGGLIFRSFCGVCAFKIYVLLCKSENTDDTQLLLRTNRHIYELKMKCH